MQTKNFPFVIFSLAIFFLASCAQVVSPTGGDKDIVPPKLLWSTPTMEPTQFKADKIILEFDEFIQLRNFKDQFLVSPPMKKEPIVEIRGKKLHISIEDTLKANTTYVMNFGNSVVDLNEGNPYGNLKYVFSTGDVVDSLQLKGLVLDAYEAKTESGTLVMLYENIDDSIPYIELPNYTSRTNDDGEFVITNIKAGSYKVFALNDKNQNYIYDRPDEEIAFLEKNIVLPSKNDSMQLSLFQEKEKKHFIKDKKVVDGSFQLVFNLPTDSIYLAPLAKEKLPSHFIKRNAQKDSVEIWFQKLTEPLNLNAVILDQKRVYDTVKIKIPAMQDTIINTTSSISVQNFFSPLKITFERPIGKINKNKIQLLQNDSIPVDFKLGHQKNSTNLMVDVKWKENSIYTLSLLPNAIVDLYGITNDSLKISFRTNASKDFSRFKIKINTKNKSPKILELLDASGKVIQQKNVTSEFIKFEHLKPGDYRLKLIFDSNNNKKWDTGNYLSKQSPEKVVLFDGTISLRPNWEKELIWELK